MTVPASMWQLGELARQVISLFIVADALARLCCIQLGFQFNTKKNQAERCTRHIQFGISVDCILEASVVLANMLGMPF
uniref:Putative secreted protein n=1 Tax=Ixodes ricinus TaxID=34613 RepID=A0A6B0TWL8_IXORI